MRPLPLRALHASPSTRFGEVDGAEVVQAFGRLEDEYRAAREAAGVADLSFREWLRVAGANRVSFLHGMVTNDVDGLAEGHTRYAAMLTPKGAMVSDARIWRRAPDLLLDVGPGLAAKVKAFLDAHLISEDAEVQEVTGSWALIGLYGPRARELASAAAGAELAPPDDAFAAARIGGVEVLAAGADVLGPGGVELAAPREALGPVWQRLLEVAAPLGARPIGFEALEVVRVEAGIPRYGRDLDEKTIPLEANLQRAISYQKGCYVGQEVIARATFRGHVNRKLVGLSFQGEPPGPGAELRSGDRKVGWVSSSVRSPSRGAIGLGFVHRDFTEPGTALAAAPTGAKASVEALPFA